MSDTALSVAGSAAQEARLRTLMLYLDARPHPDALVHPDALRWVRPETGTVWGFKPQTGGRVLLTPITTKDCDGYVVLKAQQHHYKAHVLVWEVINGPIPRSGSRKTQLQVNHLNFIRHDNRITNLELLAPGPNVRYSAAAGHLPGRAGETSPMAKLTEAQAREILAQPDSSGHSLAIRYGVSDAAICMLRKGKTWTHLQLQQLPVC